MPSGSDGLVCGIWRSGRVEACIGDAGERVGYHGGSTDLCYTLNIFVVLVQSVLSRGSVTRIATVVFFSNSRIADLVSADEA